MYCIDQSSDEPIMLINSFIGFDEEDGQGVDGAEFQRELLYLDTLGKKRIQVWINSLGGSMIDGYNIASAILKTKTPVDTYNVGLAASMAGVIFMCGRNRVMMDYAQFMMHPVQNAVDKKLIKSFTDSASSLLSSKSDITQEQVSELMNETTWLNAEQCLAKGFCTEIEKVANVNKKRMSTANVENFLKEASLITNKLIQPKTIIKMENNFTKVTMRLKLNDAARQEDVVAEIDKIENRANELETQLSDLTIDAQNKATKSQEQLDKMKATIDKLTAEYEKATNDLKDANDKLEAVATDAANAAALAAETEAKNAIEGFAKAGRIKNDATTILEWTGTAKAIGIDKVKSMIEALPLNKEAVKITEGVTNALDEGALPTTAIGLAVKNKLKREGKL